MQYNLYRKKYVLKSQFLKIDFQNNYLLFGSNYFQLQSIAIFIPWMLSLIFDEYGLIYDQYDTTMTNMTTWHPGPSDIVITELSSFLLS